MDKLTVVVCCVVLLVGVATAFPGQGSWRRAAAESSHPDRDVEVVEPVRGGGSRGGLSPDSDESPEVIPFGIGTILRGVGPVRPVLAIRPLGPRDSTESDESDEDFGGPGGYAPGGFLHPYLIDPMSDFMAQMAEMMAAMRRQMTQVLNRLPTEGTTDLSKLGNTTSTTKVVDGHVITVNDTIIDSKDNDGSVLRVRVIDIHPSESPEDADATPTDKPDDADKKVSTSSVKDDKDDNDDKDVEPLENSDEAKPKANRAENEIPMKVGSEVDDLNA